LISASSGGGNHISNCVLSCKNCNSKEKLDMSWEEFLSKKVQDKNLMNKRKEKILQWQKENGAFQRKINSKILEEADSMCNEVIELYDQKVLELRKLHNNNNF
jgi:Cu2+-containing amine oxidase